MKPVIYQLAHSPYCLPITRALEALGVEHTVVNVSNGDRSEIIRLTGGAYYQVPVVQYGERVLFDLGGDGLDVPRFIDREFGGGRLFPREFEGLQLILVPHIENNIELPVFKLTDIHYVPAIADMVERALVIRHKERRFGRGCIDQWRAGKDALVAEAVSLLKPFDLIVAQKPFLVTDTPVYTDFALYGILANLTYNGWNPFPGGLPDLQRWFTTMQSFRY
jgi:glutathione S-transferase